MKKIISMLLCVCLLLTAAAVTASATDNGGKISSELLGLLNEGNGTVSVCVFLKDCVNESEVEKYVLENYENADKDADVFLKYYRQRVSEIVSEYIEKFVDENKGLFEEITLKSTSAEFLIANVKAENIQKLAENELVTSIDFWDNSEEIIPANSTEKSTETAPAATEPSTTGQPTEATEATTGLGPTICPPMPPNTLKANTLKVTAKNKTFRAKKLKSRKQTAKVLTIKNAQGALTVKLVKDGTTAKIYRKITVNKKGVITLKKGKYAKKTYKIRLNITAKGNSNYSKKVVYRTVKLSVK